MQKNLLPFEAVQRKILVRKESETDLRYGCSPDNRPVNVLINYGIINLNKPKGPTSHQVSDYVQKILHIDKAGHAGTLDPGVTGVLPVATGRATRIVQALLPAGKEYVAIMHLHKPVPLEELKNTLNEFVGRIKQLPPIKSSVKRQVRERNIYYLEIIEVEEQDVLFRIGCQAGTYIRKFCHDVGQKLGTGAHMAELVRTKAGPFNADDMITLQDLADAYWYWKNECNEDLIRKCIKPVEAGIVHLPKIWVMDNAVDPLCHGAVLNVPGISKLNTEINKDDTVAVMTLKDELVALGK
ncbi:MAG: RNA-guided pseudouridylation complex pseudouridine synthase subunit Cbf5, partial [Candidatus Woesearchaeota archaeon]